MSDRYRLLRRGNRYYAVDRQTRGRQSLGTNDPGTAQKLLAARNETARCAQLNFSIGRTYLSAHDPALIERTWNQVVDEFCRRGQEHTHRRRIRAMKSEPFQRLRDKRLVETTADQIREVLRMGGSSTNHFVRCLHNLALGLGWLPAPIVPPNCGPLRRASPAVVSRWPNMKPPTMPRQESLWCDDGGNLIQFPESNLPCLSGQRPRCSSVNRNRFGRLY